MKAICIVLVWLCIAGLTGLAAETANPSAQPGVTVLEVKEACFHLNGRPAFLLGISYYGGLGASEDFTRRDLDDAQRHGFNWLRVWATWTQSDEDVSAVKAKGLAREPYLGKLKWLVAECDRRGMVVDVTLTRGKASPSGGRIPDLPAHLQAVETLVNALKAHRNWYLDLANERDVRDDRYVSPEDLKTLRELVRRLDPPRLVTASFGGHDLTEADVRESLLTVGLDFVGPHRPRGAESAAQTEAQTRKTLAMMKPLGRVVPVHYQEPFRRGYQAWEPAAADFLADLRGAVAGGAAGWCFHNGSQRGAPDNRPGRSFDLRTQRLFDQLDAEERKVIAGAALEAARWSASPASNAGVQRVLRLAPGPGNPRNSEGDFVALKDGRLLFVYTRFTGGAGDHARADLASRESRDGGLTWTPKDEVVVRNEGDWNIMSVSLLRLQSGRIALFYLRKNSLQDCRPLLRYSDDEARTWSAPGECITDEIGYYVLNNDRVIQLGGGRLIAPVAQHTKTGEKALRDGIAMCYLSDNEGKAWRRGSSLLSTNAQGRRISFMEPGVVELADGRLLMLLRTRIGCQYQSWSRDAGETWSVPEPSALHGPEAPATVERIPGTPNLLAAWNDHRGQPESRRLARPPIRTPLALAVSKDGGATWGPARIIESDPDSGYCYTAMEFVGRRVLLGYCAHKSRWGLETTQITAIDLEQLEP